MRLLRVTLLTTIGAASLLTPQTKPRARAVGGKLEGTPGPACAITDVAGVEVGKCSERTPSTSPIFSLGREEVGVPGLDPLASECQLDDNASRHFI